MTESRGPAEGSRRRGAWAPTTKAGRWAVSLVAAFAAVLAFNLVFMQNLGETDSLRNILPLFGVGLPLLAVGAGVFSVVALKKGEKSLLLFLPLALGGMIVTLLLGEFLMPLLIPSLRH